MAAGRASIGYLGWRGIWGEDYMAEYVDLLRSGVEARNQGRFDSGLAMLIEATETAPSEWQANYELGSHYAAQGEPELARAWLLRALQRAPGNELALCGLATVAAALGRVREVDALLRHAAFRVGDCDPGVIADYARFSASNSADVREQLAGTLDRRFHPQLVDAVGLEVQSLRALEEERGFAHVRLGDGEAALMSMAPQLELRFSSLLSFSREKFCRDFLGERYHLNRHFVMECRGLLERIQEIDILAYPMLARIEYAQARSDLLAAPVMLALQSTLLSLPELPQARTWTEMHWDFLRSGGLGRVVAKARGVAMITSRPAAVEFIRATFPEMEVEAVLVPSEARSTNPLDPPETTAGGGHLYPERYEAVRSWLSESDLQGWLVLVGAGPLGKHFVLDAKGAGAVAFDLGAVMDAWAGLERRNVASDFVLR